jgi:chaperonin GroES
MSEVKKVNFQPMGPALLIKVLVREERRVGKIWVPPTAIQETIYQEGIVMAVGTDESLQKSVQVGDKVILGRYNGQSIEIDGEIYKIINKSFVLAKIIEEEK